VRVRFAPLVARGRAPLRLCSLDCWAKDPSMLRGGSPLFGVPRVGQRWAVGCHLERQGAGASPRAGVWSVECGTQVAALGCWLQRTLEVSLRCAAWLPGWLPGWLPVCLCATARVSVARTVPASLWERALVRTSRTDGDMAADEAPPFGRYNVLPDQAADHRPLDVAHGVPPPRAAPALLR